jgi:putative selenate reductase
VYKTATISANKGKTVISNEGTFEIKQKYQILHIADWCNECGNCATFCPTAGKPYSDKPHLYLTKESFEKNRDGFFYENNLLTGYLDNEKYSFRELKNQYIFQSKSISVKLDKQTFKIVDMEIKEKSTFEVSLKFAAEMKVVFEGAKSFWE